MAGHTLRRPSPAISVGTEAVEVIEKARELAVTCSSAKGRRYWPSCGNGAKILADGELPLSLVELRSCRLAHAVFNPATVVVTGPLTQESNLDSARGRAVLPLN